MPKAGTAGRIQLTSEQKAFITTRLACFDAPSQVRDAFEKEYGVRLTVQTIVWYDPTIGRSRPLAECWTKLFNDTREKFLKDVSRIAISHKSFRMRKLQEILDKELERQNTVGARETLKQAAEEDGGKFTNKHEVTGANGAPIPLAMTVTFVEPGQPKP